MSRWIERYRAGQCRQVWTEMTSLGPDLRSVEDAWSAATAVARETMRRARHNVERLVERLPKYGFEFESAPLSDPPPDATTQLDALESEIGLLPLSLRTWFEEVGQVNLNGAHPEWTFEYPDPLVVDAPVEYIRSEYEAWHADRGTEWERGSTFEVPVAPDYLHKANVSGGMPYGLAVPNPGATGCSSGSRTRPRSSTTCASRSSWAGCRVGSVSRLWSRIGLSRRSLRRPGFLSFGERCFHSESSGYRLEAHARARCPVGRVLPVAHCDSGRS